MCPEYLSEVIAGAEGAILLVCWTQGAAPELAELENVAVDVVYKSSSSTETGSIGSSFSLFIEEGETYVCELQFHQSTVAGSSSVVKRYDDKGDGLFGEIGVTIDGLLRIQWNRIGEAPDAPTREIKVPTGFEYGPMYTVDAEGHLERTANGQLSYAPHKYVLDAPTATWATVRLPVVKSDVAGPHRHCYT